MPEKKMKYRLTRQEIGSNQTPMNFSRSFPMLLPILFLQIWLCLNSYQLAARSIARYSSAPGLKATFVALQWNMFHKTVALTVCTWVIVGSIFFMSAYMNTHRSRRKKKWITGY